MTLHDWCSLFTTCFTAALGGAGLGLALALRQRWRAVEERLERVESELVDLTVFMLSFVRRYGETPLPAELLTQQQLLWRRFADYFREDRFDHRQEGKNPLGGEGGG